MEQRAPEIIFTVLLGGTLIIWTGIILFSKTVLRKELQATTLGLATMIAAVNAQKLLRAGVTSFLDPDCIFDVGIDLRDAIEGGEAS